MLILPRCFRVARSLAFNPGYTITDTRLLIFPEQHLHQPPAHRGLDGEHSLFRLEFEQRLALGNVIPYVLEPANEPGALHHQSDFGNFLCD
jgi:hypothetical protein